MSGLVDQLGNVPECLRSRPQWVVWRYEERDGKRTKVPYNPITRNKAATNDPRTWAGFDHAVKAYQNGGYDGVGYVFAADDGIAGFDLDKCIGEDGLSDFAAEWVADFASYTEITPSGTGLHVIVMATLPDGKGHKNSRCEVYDRGRFFTVTGNLWPGSTREVREAGAEVLRLVAEQFPDSGKVEALPLEPEPVTTTADDDALLERLTARSQRFYELFTLGQGGPDASENDYALACLFGEEGAGAQQIDRLFRASKLYRAKWDSKRGETTYGALTIERALQHVRAEGAKMAAQASQNGARGDKIRFVSTAPAWADGPDAGPPPEPPEWEAYNVPDLGIDGDEEPDAAHPLEVTPTRPLQLGWIDAYAQHAAVRTASPLDFSRLVALVTAATAIRRRAALRMSFGTVYPNLYAAIVAPSTVYHKSTAQGMGRNLLWRAQLEGLLLPAEFTPEGLLRGLAGQAGGVVIRDEIGRLFDSHNVKYLREIKPLLTELYDGGTVKKQLSHEAITVNAPCLNVLGATTPARFYDAIGLLDWRDGFLPRWIFALPEGEPDFDAEPAMYTPDDDRRFGELAAVLAQLDRQHDTDFAIDQEAFDLWRQWRKAGTRAAYEFGDEVVMAIVGRYATHALKFALILAAVNGSWGRIEAGTMQSACDLADHYKGVARRMLAEREEHEISGARLQKVYRVVALASRNQKMATERSIMRALHMTKAQIAPLLERLCDTGAVLTEEAGRSVRYLPADPGAQALPIRGVGK